MDLDKRPQTAPRPATAPAAGPAAGPGLRASDAERDHYAAILREALAEGRLTAEEHTERVEAVYSSRTQAQLEPLVADLPRPGAASVPPAAAGASGQAGPQESLFAVFSESVRRGHWRPAPRIRAIAVFGSVEIDLSEAVFEHRHLTIQAIAVFGSVEIRVPENVTLHGSGSGVLGQFEVDGLQATEPEAPSVQVDGFAVLGSVEAKPKRGRFIKELSRHLRKRLG
ncbi:DUF1707 SHOCT-like domain-containing protein [Streptomyces sp. SPB074]|uniref:DUF1707 SHOCT-like domain-containing protein n=1 Tax=Streptomyces sp. (strain SPB074) TaxID=465543 RepID=UPI00017F1783|nr:DUF1707 domain-containing protein [Streptomyces sp. SPB074]